MVLLAAATVGAQAPTAAPPKKTAPPKGATAGAAELARLLEAAAEARRVENWEEAIALYQKAVKLKPTYVEGYWYQGTSYYSLDKFAECRQQFDRHATGAEERRQYVSRPVRVRPHDRPVAAALLSRGARRRRTPTASVARYRRRPHDAHQQFEQVSTRSGFASEGTTILV